MRATIIENVDPKVGVVLLHDRRPLGNVSAAVFDRYGRFLCEGEGHDADAAIENAFERGRCRRCDGIGAEPGTDNTNWLPCRSCNGIGYIR